MWRRPVGEVELPHVADDPDDRAAEALVPGAPTSKQPLTDRILVRPVPARCLLANQQHRRRAGAVFIRESAAAQERDAHRPEVIGCRDAHLSTRFVRSGSRGSSTDGKGETEAGRREGKRE